MKILAFETSCDDTGVAIIENGTRVLANVKHSQVEHSEWGGVVPEIAARLHSERWEAVLKECLSQANCTLNNIDALAVTAGPGLQTSLLVGTTASSFLSLLTGKKLIPVQHIAGHIASVTLERDVSDFTFPTLTLVASGGHTDFYVGKSFSDLTRIGQTIDDAVGEAFDKVAKMLNLGYPGGPLVSEKAEKGDGTAFKLPRPLLAKDSLDFSFSGVKAAIYRIVQENPFFCHPVLDTGSSQNKKFFSEKRTQCSLDSRPPIGVEGRLRGNDGGENGNDREKQKFIADVCASFEQCVVDIFLEKLDRALSQFNECRAVHFVGGVSANKRLRAEIEKFCMENSVQFFTTAKCEYSTDNAAMIGAAAYFVYRKNPDIAKVQFIDADPGLTMSNEQ